MWYTKYMTKYVKIYNHVLENYIKKLKVGDIIPFEVDIAEEFNVSRMTVNKAISALVDEGYLKRIKGKGTYIIAQSSNSVKDLGELYSYSEDMQKRNIRPQTRLLSYEFLESVDDYTREIMQMTEEDNLHKIVRLRYADEKPISIDYTYVVTKYVPELNSAKLTESMLVYYETEAGIKIGYEDQNITATIANEELANLLDISVGAPLLRIDGFLSTDEDEIFEHSEVYYIPDWYTLKKRAYRPTKEK